MRNRFGGEDILSGLWLVKLGVLRTALPSPRDSSVGNNSQYEGLVRQSGLFPQIAHTPKATNSSRCGGSRRGDTQKRAMTHPCRVVHGAILIHISTAPTPTPCITGLGTRIPFSVLQAPRARPVNLATWLRWSGAAPFVHRSHRLRESSGDTGAHGAAGGSELP